MTSKAKKKKSNKKLLVPIALLSLLFILALAGAAIISNQMGSPKRAAASMRRGERKIALAQYSNYIQLNNLLLHQDNKVLSDCYFGLGRCYVAVADWKQAKPNFAKAYEIRKKALGDGDESTLVAKVFWDTANCLSDPGNSGDEQLTALLKEARSKFGPEAFSAACCLDSLGAWFAVHKRYEEAITSFETAADLDDLHMATHDPLLSRLSLALLYMQMSQEKQGQSYYASNAYSELQELQKRIIEVFGTDTPYLVPIYEFEGLAIIASGHGESSREQGWAVMYQANALGEKLVKEGKIDKDLIDGIKRQNSRIFSQLGI